MKSEKFYTSYSKLSEIKLITIGIAPTELIKFWAEKTLPNGKVLGEVINPNTLHHKTFKPLKGGLFCERIFGPLKDFECACGKKPFMSKKEKGFFLDQSELREPTASFGPEEASRKMSPKTMRSLKLNRIYNKTKSIFGTISSKIRKYCPSCEVEYTWSVIRRYQLGYINLIAPVTHIWYLKGTPSYLSILLDLKKRDLVSVIYCTATLTIENILKGSIPTLKSADIVSSWKNLKKQINSQKLGSLRFDLVPSSLPFPSVGREQERSRGQEGTNNLSLKQSSLYTTSSFISLVQSKIKRRRMLKVTRKFNFAFTSFFGDWYEKGKITSAEDNEWDPSSAIGFVPPAPLWETEEVKETKENYYAINFTKLKVLSKLLIESKKNSLKFSTLSTNRLFPKDTFKKISINNYILLYLNVFSENKIWLTSIEIAWSWLVKKVYKTIILRIEQISKKLDYLQVKPTQIFNTIRLKKDNHLSNSYTNKSSIFQNNYWKEFDQSKYFNYQNQSKYFNYQRKYFIDKDYSSRSSKKSSKKKFINLMKFLLGLNSSYSGRSLPSRTGKGRKRALGFVPSFLRAQGRKKKRHIKKMNNNTNNFHSFQSIELYTLSIYSTSKIYYLRSKILSQSFLKKINSFFNKNNSTLTNMSLLSEPPEVFTKWNQKELTGLDSPRGKETSLPKEIRKDFLRQNDFFKDPTITSELNLRLQSQKNKSLSKYLKIFNSLSKFFLMNLFNKGSFKSTLFQRYFEYSILDFSSVDSKRTSVFLGPSPLLPPFPVGDERDTNQLKKIQKKLIPTLKKSSINIKGNVENFLIQLKRFVSIASNLNFSSISERISWKTNKSRLIQHFSMKKSFVNLSPTASLPLAFPSVRREQERSRGFVPSLRTEGKEQKGKKIYPLFLVKQKVRNPLNKSSLFYSLLKKFHSNQLKKKKKIFKRIRNKIYYKKKSPKNLYNNFYCLSYRQLWRNDNDWNIVYYYLFPPTAHSKMIIPSYQIRHPNQVPSFFPQGPSSLGTRARSEGEGTKTALGIIKNGDSTESNSHLLNEFVSKRNNSFCKKESFFSGSFVIQKLLQEYPLYEIKQIDKQNRILLYQLNKQIAKIKSKIKSDKSLIKDLKKSYRTRDLLIRRTKVIRKIFRKNSTPDSLVLSVLPVLPPDLRPIVKMGNQIAASDLNRLYQRIIYRNERLKNFLKDSATSNSFEMKYAQRLLQEAVDNLIQNGKSGNGSEKDSRGRLLKSLSDLLKGKQGRFRQYLLGKRVDYSGRSVIVVGPKLKLHECGLPKEIALELYLPFLLKRMLNQKVAQTIVGAKLLIKTNPDLIYELLREIMQTSPILLNRAPTLHRLGIQAFQPILIEGRAILLHPLVCSAFNADFDGDQMAVHVPITVEARAEAWKLMLSRNNILAPSTGDPLAIPSQDMVLGCYYLTTNLLNSKINYSSKKLGSGLFFTKINHVEKAYELKTLDLHANIWLKWSGLVENGLDQEEPIEIRIDSSGKWKEILNKYQKNYSFNNLLQNTYILTTVGRVLFNIKIQNCLYLQ